MLLLLIYVLPSVRLVPCAARLRSGCDGLLGLENLLHPGPSWPQVSRSVGRSVFRWLGLWRSLTSNHLFKALFFFFFNFFDSSALLLRHFFNLTHSH